jgi:hypothetical protein
LAVIAKVGDSLMDKTRADSTLAAGLLKMASLLVGVHKQAAGACKKMKNATFYAKTTCRGSQRPAFFTALTHCFWQFFSQCR